MRIGNSLKIMIKQWVQDKIDSGELLKLDLGAGNKHKEGFIRIDKAEAVDPDILCDFDNNGIPLPNRSVGEIEAIAVLEHCKNVIFMINEMWRVCENGAKIFIGVPHPSCDDQYGDPTHISFFTEHSASYWDCRSFHYTNTDYGVKSKFNVLKVEFEYDPDLELIPEANRAFAIKHFRNIITRVHFYLEAQK